MQEIPFEEDNACCKYSTNFKLSVLKLQFNKEMQEVNVAQRLVDRQLYYLFKSKLAVLSSDQLGHREYICTGIMK